MSASESSPGHGRNNNQAVKQDASVDAAIATTTHAGIPNQIVRSWLGQYQGIPIARSRR
jgi:hypothetical protein